MLSQRSVPRFLCVLSLCLTFACLAPAHALAQSQKEDIRVYVSVLDSKTVSDVFGSRIGDRFVAIQVTITNRNEQFQYLLHDVSLDLKKIFVQCASTPDAKTLAYAESAPNTRNERDERQEADPKKRDDKKPLVRAALNPVVGNCDDTAFPYEISSLELSLMRGVAEKGQGQDKRNKILRLFRGVGTVAAGLIGVATFGPSFAESVAVFNGPVLSAYTDVWPDYTINQMNRLNDSAYKSNTLVPKQQSKVLVAFIPQRMFLTKAQRKQFKDDPTSLFNEIDFRRTVAVVDGNFVAELKNLPPLVTSVQFEASELAKFQSSAPEVKGYVVGRFLQGSKISLLNQTPKGLSVEVDGTPTESRLNFIVKATDPVPPDTSLNFEVSNDHGVQTYSKAIGYVMARPTVTGIDEKEAAQGTDIDVTITGTNFVPGATTIKFPSGSRIRATINEVTSTTITATFSIDGKAPVRANNIKVANANADSAEPVTFTVTKAPTDSPE